ncbi:dephospho-CoA kinase [Agathobaculum desmolans]|uniref:dephospho-CoA kinase n=1 Tax=Agathobaculum desmolans TaxID=39484 RepID=UPI00248EC887|nr:dephospho-CoA kinase [Agathobaculum desmolans]
MKIIGLTGGSGTGKGTVATRMQALGAGWVDADAVYRDLCAHDRTMLAALDAAFGGVLDADGRLDRPKLAAIVFSDPEKLQTLNQITVPYIRAASLAAIRTQGDCPIVLYDAPTLFEAGMNDLCEQVIGVLADPEIRVQRVMARDGIGEAAARARIAAQPEDGFYRTRCDHILENNGDLSALWRDTDALYTILRKGEEK